MNEAEGTGRTVDDAVAVALRQLGLTQDEVDIEILQEPRPALLGLGGKEARVRVTRRQTSCEECRDFTASVLGMMGYEARVDARETDEGIVVTLEGGDLGGLIGRYGRTLDSLEFLVALHQVRRFGRRLPVMLDVAGYRARRQKSLEETARQAAEHAVTEGRPIPLAPMEPRDRRTVHMALADDPRVTTVSEGEDESRHVVVVPRQDGARHMQPDEVLDEVLDEAPAGG